MRHNVYRKIYKNFVELPFPPQHVSVVEFSSLDARSSEWDDDLTQVNMRMNNSTNIVIAIAIIIGADLKCQLIA